MEGLLAYLRANALELSGFVTGAACVWLIARQNIWNWPLGIANNLLFMVLFTRSGLYADVGLQVFYVAVGIYGWWHWLHGGLDHGALKVSRTPPAEAALVGALTLAGTALVVLLLKRFTPSTVPVLDATVTGLSVAAQVLMARKRLENWWIWIGANLISIGLLIYKQLFITAGLYAVFLAICIAGLVEWTRSWRMEAR
ncbi:MAG: nicotinamide mononucleotide transporter [Holophagaceae bacterium]|nr:nicotinamide mononucleotide transporter [Holophagaceae bacterium]